MPRLVVSAGMPRSGSTWLYNVARLALQAQHGAGAVAAGWIGDRDRLPAAPVLLLKVHDFDAALAAGAWRVLWSYRDLRDVLASLQRKFGTPATEAGADHFVVQHGHWRVRAAHAMRYESMLADPEAEVQAVCRSLEVDPSHAAGVLHATQRLGYDTEGTRNDRYHETTLYHRGHVTDGRHGAWRDTLPAGLAAAVSRRHAAWLQAHGYAGNDAAEGTEPHDAGSSP